MKKYIKIIFILLISFIFSTNIVLAKNNNKSLFQAGDKIKINEKLNGTSFIAGNKIEVNKEIDGIGFIAGNKIDINSKQNYLMIAGETIKINNDIDKDIFIAGNTINIKNNTINRDAYIAGETINLNTKLDRNIYIYGETVNIKGEYLGNVKIYATNININKDTKINGTLKYNKEASIKGLNDNIKTNTYIGIKKVSYKELIKTFIYSYLHIAILGIVLLFFLEKIFVKIKEDNKDLTTKSISVLCGKGLLILIGIPIISIMLIVSDLFISAGLISLLLYGICIYVSNIFTSYILMTKIDNKYLNSNMNNYLKVILGLLIINIINLVPIIGPILYLFSITFGLGIIGNLLIDIKK